MSYNSITKSHYLIAYKHLYYTALIVQNPNEYNPFWQGAILNPKNFTIVQSPILAQVLLMYYL